MRKVYKLFLFTGALALLLGCTTACSSSDDNYQKIDDDTVQYSTDDAIDPANYTTYVNKELDLVMNILSTHVSVGDNIIKGKYSADDEAESVKADLDMVNEAIASVESLHPPTDYEDDRDAILAKMVNAKGALQAYYDILTSDSLDTLQDSVDLMESEYISLSGSFNLPWE